MCKLRPLLQDWLAETEHLLSVGATVQDVMEGVAVQRIADQQQKQEEEKAMMAPEATAQMAQLAMAQCHRACESANDEMMASIQQQQVDKLPPLPLPLPPETLDL